MFCILLCRRGHVLVFCKALLCSCIELLPWNLYCFFTLNSSVNVARSSLNAVCWWKLHGKSIQLKTFPRGNIISPCGVVINKVFRLIVVTYSSIEPVLFAYLCYCFL